MIDRIRQRLGQLRRYPRDLYRGVVDLRDVVASQNTAFQHEAQGLNEQLPQIADALLQVLTRLQDMQDRNSGNGAAAEHLVDQLKAWREADIARFEAPLRSLESQVKEVAKTQRELRWLLPTQLWAPEVNERVRQTLSALRPFRLADVAKVRLGRDIDGGYVVIDDFAETDAVISLGIGDDVSWDLAMADRGMRVVMCDHTVEKAPVPNPRFEFRQVRVGPADEAGSVSLGTLVREQQAKGARRIILKIDIEDAEWKVLTATDRAALAACSQIVCEFHGLHRLADPEFAALAGRCFGALTQDFFVCHVHGNNCADIYNVGNVTIPDCLEVTFANRSIYRPLDEAELFPTPLDQPNQPERADIFLGTFRFTA